MNQMVWPIPGRVCVLHVVEPAALVKGNELRTSIRSSSNPSPDGITPQPRLTCDLAR